MMTDLFGSNAQTLHLDLESVALTTLDRPSLQADVRDLPLVDDSVTTHTTSNLFTYLDEEDIFSHVARYTEHSSHGVLM